MLTCNLHIIALPYYEVGKCLGDFFAEAQALSRSMSDSTKLEKHLKTFDDMKQKMIEIWNSK